MSRNIGLRKNKIIITLIDFDRFGIARARMIDNAARALCAIQKRFGSLIVVVVVGRTVPAKDYVGQRRERQPFNN